MPLLHPSIAPWLQRDDLGLTVTVLLRELTPAAVFVRHLPDNEEELVPLQRLDAGSPAGWQAWRGRIAWDGGNEVTRYSFKVLTDDTSVWLAADGLHPQVPPDAVHFRVNRLHAPPSWVAEQVFYQIFPDRFARGAEGPVKLPLDVPGMPANQVLPWGERPPLDRPTTVFYGGDLDGITGRLDYLQDRLGATALYLNPIFRSRSNHKYDTEDYTEVDPGLGGNAALQVLREATRARGMKLVLDAVVNHTGAQHRWFNRGGGHDTVGACHAEDSPWRRWYAFTSAGQCLGWKGYDSLPVLDYSNPAVKAAMFEAPESVMRRWMQAPYAIDGWRLDAVHMLGEGLGAWNNAGVMREMRRAVKAHDPQAYLVGEHFNEATSWLQGDQEDAAMNYYGFAHPVRAWLAGLDLNAHPVRLSTTDFARWLRHGMATIPYDNQLAQFNLLDSHDTPRFLTLLQGDVDAMRLAVTLLFTYPGSPCVYYGDEIGLEGGADPDCRRCFDWDPARWNAELFEHYRAAIARRQTRRELRQGAFVELAAHGEVYAFARFTEDGATVVAVNRGRQPASVQPALSVLPNGIALPSRLEIAGRESFVWSSS